MKIEFRKHYVDVDKKKKLQKGISITLEEWEKIKAAVKYIDNKIAMLQS